MIQVKSFFGFNDLRNYSYLILDTDSGESWVIDPYEAGPIIDYIKKNSLVLKGILNTHLHFDHIRGNEPLQKEFGSPITKLKSSETLNLGGSNQLKTLDAPGHTMDHQVFVWRKGEKSTALFAGDTLFNAGVGNCKNGGDVNELYQTVRMLFSSLPGETLLYPGHDYLERNLQFSKMVEPENQNVSELLRRVKDENIEDRKPFTLNEERLINPFIRLDSEEIRDNLKIQTNSLVNEDGLKRELFKTIRGLRDKW